MDQKRPSGFSGTVEIHQEEEQGTTKTWQKYTLQRAQEKKRNRNRNQIWRKYCGMSKSLIKRFWNWSGRKENTHVEMQQRTDEKEKADRWLKDQRNERDRDRDREGGRKEETYRVGEEEELRRGRIRANGMRPCQILQTERIQRNPIFLLCAYTDTE